MAYSRWGGSEWYIFWKSSEDFRKNKQTLAIWNSSVIESLDEADRPLFHYTEVKKMVKNPETIVEKVKFAKDQHVDFIARIMKEWVTDVDEEYKFR